LRAEIHKHKAEAVNTRPTTFLSHTFHRLVRLL